MKTAVLYLRVSTSAQVETDYDPEGISIPAQRAACTRKAEQMGIAIVGEYVEPGRSATSMDKRPVFQALMARLKSEHDADYVIVYNLSRLNRNRVDDVQVLMKMRTLGVSLVSAQENIDDTPAGQLMHGILAAFNEYRSNADGADIRYKMSQKAKNGGTLGKAPLGYLNVRDTSLGREIRTVAIDEVRAPYVRMAFQLYASGDFTLQGLAGELQVRGLVTRGTAHRPAGPVSTSKLQSMLRDRYYLGVVTYDGADYPGRHEPLVDLAVFNQVQGVLDAHATAGERMRRHHHYLKGTLWCAACHAHGTESRMILQHTVGRHGGEYYYFFCIARQRGLCDTGYLAVDRVEQAVLRHYEGIRLPEGFADRVRSKLDDVLADEGYASGLMKTHLTERLARLEQQEENLLDLAADAALPRTKLRDRLKTLAAEREALTHELARTNRDLMAGAVVIRSALDLIADIPELYRQSSDVGRRAINQTFFTRLYVDADRVHGEELREPFDELLYLRRRLAPARHYRLRRQTRRGSVRVDTASTSFTRASLLETALSGGGSSKTALVDVKGLEPLTSRV
jgi:site-specific DNA recombinase